MSVKTKSVAGAVATLVFVGGWEGLRLTAYRDVVGVPTICYGETLGVKMGDTATKAECDAMLIASLKKHEAGLDRCLRPPTAIPTKTKIALVSWTYNVGVGAACSSTAVRRFNAGDYHSGCESVTWWNKGTVNGKRVTIPGLVNRRAAEYSLCVADL